MEKSVVTDKPEASNLEQNGVSNSRNPKNKTHVKKKNSSTKNGAEKPSPELVSKQSLATETDANVRVNETQTQTSPVTEDILVVDLTEGNAASEAYEEIIKWKRNLFDLPKGNLGKKFIEELTKHLNKWAATKNNKSIQLVMIMPSLLLQRTAKSCKGRVNKDNLRRRFELWDAGKLNELVDEGKCLQSRLTAPTGTQNDEENVVKKFRTHMLRGNVNAALRLLSNTGKSGLLKMDEDTIEQLHEKHPEGQPKNNIMLMGGPIQHVHPVIFDEMNEELVQKVALKTRGAAGPSNFDASDWKSILVSRVHGTSSVDLCRAIVNVARKLCTENVNENVEALMACRLIPLDKNPGLRPIGIGEVLRRIIGKMVVSVLRSDLQEGAGDLQLCAGQQSGCEVGIHAMSDIYDDDDTH